MSDGKDYEQFVKSLQQALLDSEKFSEQKNIEIEINKKILDNFVGLSANLICTGSTN